MKMSRDDERCEAVDEAWEALPDDLSWDSLGRLSGCMGAVTAASVMHAGITYRVHCIVKLLMCCAGLRTKLIYSHPECH